MKCRTFEDRMEDYCLKLDVKNFRENLINSSQNEDWSIFFNANEHFREMTQHLSTCNDCADSILKYLDIKDRINYLEYPCIHLAYYSSHETDKCILFENNDFTIPTINDNSTSIGIGNCPWCGAPVPTSRIEYDNSKSMGIRNWQEKQKGKL